MPATTLASPAATTAQISGELDFVALLDQQGRMLQLSIALPSPALVPERMVSREGVSRGFELVLDCLSENACFEIKALIGEQATVRLLQADGSYRPMHGYVFETSRLGSDGGVARFRLVMRDWTAFLEHRIDSFVFQGQTAQQTIEDIVRDHPQSSVRFDLTAALPVRNLCCQYDESDFAFIARLLSQEGLNWHVEHLEGQEAEAADRQGRGRPVMVITDRGSRRRSLGEVRFARQHAVANLPAQRDAVTAFMMQRSVQANAATQASWDHRQLAGKSACESSALELGDVPTLEHYDGSGAYRFAHRADAERAACLALAALEFDVKHFEGEGCARHFEAGCSFTLVDHPLYGANHSAFNYGGALAAGHERPDNTFTLVAVEHHVTNNLGAQAARLLKHTALERGTYRNHFRATPAAAPIVPRHLRKPTAPGAQAAVVVGLPGEAVFSDRDHCVKIQFPWQRGCAPLPGGLAHDQRSPDLQGNAPGDHRSGTWVRVALPAAGANWGAVFTPRIGTEVAVEFIEGDIDRPVITGLLPNEQDLPPFSAGVGSGANHPGVISGLHTQALDGIAFNQWAIDDARGMLRMRLHCSYNAAELGLGHLIQQAGLSSVRGAWRGSGFEAGARGWASLRAGRGLLLSTNRRAGTYGSAQGTQMDATEALAQMRRAQVLGQGLSEAACIAGALCLSSVKPGQALERFADGIDPTRQGKHADSVNGQAAKKADADGRSPGEPTEAFAQPTLLLDTPTSALWATEAGVASFAGQDTCLVAEGDVQQTAAHTCSAISGQTASFHAHDGGILAFAANGPVSLRAHNDSLQMLAAQEVTVVSVHDEIRISAGTRVELLGADSSLVLDGGDITLTTPGAFEAKGAAHAFLGGGSKCAATPVLPDSRVKLFDEQFQALDAISGDVLAGIPYRIDGAADGPVRGLTDKEGRTARVATSQPTALKVTWNPPLGQDSTQSGSAAGDC